MTTTDAGYNFQKKYSPVAVHVSTGFGSETSGIGIEASIGMPTCLPVAYRWNFGVSYYTNYSDSYRGWATHHGSEVNLLGASVSFKTTYHNFKGDKFDQSTSQLHLGLGPNYGFTYENDYFNPNVRDEEFLVNAGLWMSETFGIGVSDTWTDKYRTAASRVDLGNFHIGINLYTGDPGTSDDLNIYDDNGQDTYGPTMSGYNPNEYRSGVLYMGYGNFNIGINSELVRNKFQNEIAHKPNNLPYFKMLNNWIYYFWYWGAFGNSLW